MLRLALLFAFICCLQRPHAQNTIGLPEVINYTKHTYSAGIQNWDIRQDQNGILYFANNEGLLTFDGEYWRTFSLPNKTIVRSVEIGQDGRIYVGGQDELGYFKPGKNGQLHYTSLKNLIPDADNKFTDVWDIVKHGASIFFRTNKRLFQLSGNKISVFKSSEWLYLGQCNGLLLAQDYEKGLLQFTNGFWRPLAQSGFPPGALVTSFITTGKDSALITTLKHGLFILYEGKLTKLASPTLQAIADNLIYAASPAGPGRFALATSLDGVFIIDGKGSLVQHLSRKEGLQNNNILSVFLDRDQNLWLGLDNGIDFIAYNGAIKHITPDQQNGATAYTSIIYDNRLYIGTSTGLYSALLTSGKDLSFVKSSFTPVANIRGQVWNLSEVNGQLLTGHHEGAFMINGATAQPIDNGTGFWTFLPLSNVLPSATVVAGTYGGIHFYRFQDGRYLKAAQAPFESARFVTIDNGNIWVSHPYKGIFKVVPGTNSPPTVRLYQAPQGLQTINNNYIFKVKSHIVVATEGGLLEYNAASDRFEPSPYFNQLLPQKGIRFLKEDPQGNIWFIFEKALGVVDFSGKEPKTIYIPELNNKMVSGFEHIYFIDKNNVLVGGENGCFHIDFEKYRQSKGSLQALVRSVKAMGSRDSLLFGGYFGLLNEAPAQQAQNIPKLASQFNSFHITYAAMLYGQQANVQYSIYLKGFDKDWSEWTRKTEKEYTNLPAGSYTFMLKARNNLGRESAVSSYSFTVLPPWYQTGWAYLAYTLLCLGAAYGLYHWQRRKFMAQQQRHNEEQKRLQYLHQLELERNEREIIKLKNDKLETEIGFKNSELASSAMHLVQKGELIARLKDELTRLLKKVDNKAAADDLKKILRTLGNDDKMERDWAHFSQHFDQVHSNFLVALKAVHPNLSPNELKLCAYLRMNLTSKELAQLLNISVRGVEISRYRLRKKLQLPTETSLFDYLISLQTDIAAVPKAPTQPVVQDAL